MFMLRYAHVRSGSSRAAGEAPHATRSPKNTAALREETGVSRNERINTSALRESIAQDAGVGSPSSELNGFFSPAMGKS